LIHFTGGSYRWNHDLSITTDIDQFEALIKTGESLMAAANNNQTSPQNNAHKTQEYLEYFEKAIALYTGDYLPDCTDQHWVFAVRHHYRRLYLKAVSNALQLQQALGNFEAMISTASSAIQVDHYEEHFHLMYMEALLQQGNTKQALEHYEHITRFLYQEMGIAPSASFKQLYKRLLATPTAGHIASAHQLAHQLGHQSAHQLAHQLAHQAGHPAASHTGDITDTGSPDIIAALDDHGPIQNAYFCDPYVFKSIYELERRRSQRSGQQFTVAILTTKQHTNDTIAQDNLRFEAFKIHLEQHLRLGDTFAQWGHHQYVVLLPGVDEALTNRVFERVLSNYPDKQGIAIERINHLPALTANTELYTGGYREVQRQ